MKLCVALAATLLAGVTHAQEVPLFSPGDPRVRYVAFRADRSVIVKVRRGVVTRIVLERDEQIRMHGVGFGARCHVESDEWCIRAEAGESQVWVKPRTGATHNNLELATSKRDYSIRFEVLPDAPRGDAAADEIYRVMFVYPASPDGETPSAAASISAAPPATRVQVEGNLAELGCRQPYRITNTRYTRESRDSDIVPVRVFDDGVRTVFVFGDAAPMPAVFAVGPDAAESRVNFSVDGNCLRVHQLGREFVLRAGPQNMRVFNDAYAPTAAAPALREMRAAEGGRE